MKRRKTKTLLTTFLLLLFTLALRAANTKETVGQVTETVSLTTDVDYVVNGEEPFADAGVVDIVNTDHAVLIIERMKPSAVISSLLAKHVKINGAVARNNVNCQVRLYGTRGAMILPYASGFKPLTVYSEPDFKGEQCNDFGLENDGGYMVTLTDKKLNNRIRSFRLKRGYMVTFATQKSGYGYQRCFIANSEDLEISSLPQILDAKISSYRVFKWNTAGKKGLASSTNATACDALNVISCYDWGVGHDMGPDVECVANHLYEDYPSSSACGKATWTCHLKTNNEPRNSSDDRPQSLATILDNWQNLMRTGMRLCSPSSWDGSDYTDGSGFIKQFLDSIDARGWRCDLVDLHCYWLIDNFNNLGTMQSKYKRPLWISEWIWGASWNKNGAFESGKTDGDIAWGVEQIYNKLNSYGYVERYFYWNSESKGKLYDGGSLTQAGKKYAAQLTGMGYNKSYEKIPNTPPMRGGFRDFRISTAGTTATVTWHDYDGEYNQLMEVLRKRPGEAWQTWQTVSPQDAEADYKLTDQDFVEGTRYRLHIRSFSGRDYWSSEDMEPGEAIQTEKGLRYVGGNIVMNGDFQMGFTGWTNGEGQPIGQPWFQVVPKGLTDGYFLQCFANNGKDGAGSLKTAFAVEPNQDYVVRVNMNNAGDYIKVDLRQKGATTDENKATLVSNTYWSTKQVVFNSGNNNEAVLAFRWLAGTAQIADIELRKLFSTEAEALADGGALNRQRNELLAPYKAEKEKAVVDSLLTVARALADYHFEGREALQAAIDAGDRQLLEDALNGFLTLEESAVQPQTPSFDGGADGWITKAGTFTEGDQRTATQEGKTCWNAWWSGKNASEGKKQTLEIRQRIGGLPEGLYVMECKAATQHYCLSDQHGFVKAENSEKSSSLADYAETPLLTRDYLDVPSTVSAWQTLTTTPVYISGAATDTLVIGFTSSKEGAVDYAWRRYGNNETASNNGDLREGWWCATDFRLLYHPVFRFATVPQQWGVVCLPYTFRVPEGMALYRIEGIRDNHTELCLERVTEPEPGMPYVYKTDQSKVVFYANGEAVKTALRHNNVRGFFVTSTQAPVGSYLLEDGAWKRITEREAIADYSAVITKVDGMPVMTEWAGETMPIEGVADEIALGIEKPRPSTSAATTAIRYFDLGGRAVTNGKGLMVGKGKKVVIGK